LKAKKKTIILPENIKSAGDNSSLTYKQEQNLFKKFIKYNLIRKLYELQRRYIKNGKDHNSQRKIENCFPEEIEIELSKKKNRFSIRIRKSNEKQKRKHPEL
jgi:hypothetical protein